MTAVKKPNLSHLERHAEDIRGQLAVDKQSDLFEVAVEAGYLAALADGVVDDNERAAIIRAIAILSVGAVIEWEAEALVDECKTRVEGASEPEHAAHVGARLKALGQPDAGLLFAAVVAHATGGIDGSEARVLQEIGEAAGIGKGRVTEILMRAGAEPI